jgi:hypothetical protein
MNNNMIKVTYVNTKGVEETVMMTPEDKELWDIGISPFRSEDDDEPDTCEEDYM